MAKGTVSVLAVIGFANLAMILYNVATGVRCPGPTVPIVLPAGR